MRLESSYIRTTALGLTPAEQYKWKDGKCVNISTGVPYPGDQKLSNCYQLHGPPPKGVTAVWDFLKKTFVGEEDVIRRAEPTYTPTSLVLPAVAVVGGIALFLILRKKK